MGEMGILLVVLFAGLAHSQEAKDTADQLNTALDLERRGEPKAAERQLLHLLASSQSEPTTAVVLNNLAVLYTSMERYADAERSFRQAIAILAAGNNKDRLAQANLGLANLYLKIGNAAEAHRIVSAVTGDNLQAQALRANLAFHKRDFDTAELLYSEAFRSLISRRNRPPGEEIPAKVATLLNNLAVVALKQGRIADAHLRMAFSVLTWKMLAGPDSLTAAKVMNNFGAMCMEAKLYQQAEKFFAQTSKIVGNGKPSHLSLGVQLAHAEALRKLGRKIEARQMQIQAEATRRSLIREPLIDYRDLREAR